MRRRIEGDDLCRNLFEGLAMNWKSTKRSGALCNRRSNDTGPERRLRSALHKAGFRFRLQPDLQSRFRGDLVLPRYRVIVFVDGCFWHCCPRHSRWKPAGRNKTLWKNKFKRNIERDKIATSLAESLGYYVVRLWECEINSDIVTAVNNVRRACVGHLRASTKTTSTRKNLGRMES